MSNDKPIVVDRPWQFSSLAEGLEFADVIVRSRLAPKGLQTCEQVFVALQIGAEVGLPPMAALGNVAVINGRPCLFGDALLAVAMRSRQFDGERFREYFEPGDGTEDAYKAVCQVARVGQAEPHQAEFSVKDAKRAKLWGKQGPWTEHPRRMLQMRARAFALRDTFADALQGMGAAEEMWGIEANVIDRGSRADQLAAAIKPVPELPELPTGEKSPARSNRKPAGQAPRTVADDAELEQVEQRARAAAAGK